MTRYRTIVADPPWAYEDGFINGPYVELFARRQRLGWDTWGNEALEHVEIA